MTLKPNAGSFIQWGARKLVVFYPWYFLFISAVLPYSPVDIYIQNPFPSHFEPIL